MKVAFCPKENDIVANMLDKEKHNIGGQCKHLQFGMERYISLVIFSWGGGGRLPYKSDGDACRLA